MLDINPDKDYINLLKDGRFCIQKSTSSGEYVFYPRAITPGTGTNDLEWVDASGRGEVYARTVVRTRKPEDDYNVVLVALEEGPRMMSRVEGLSPDEVQIGMAVKARILEGADGEEPYVVFDPA